MKTLSIICTVLLLFALEVEAQEIQEYKILVSEDTFVQGGDTADEAMGTKSAKQLRVGNSNAKSKYARTTYLKFTLPKRIKRMQEVTLHLPVKVFNGSKNPDAKFTLEVYTVTNNDWDENTLTRNTKPDITKLVGSIDLPISEGKESTWHKIILDTYPIFKLSNSQKNRTITLALLNTKFNRTSSISPSKEQSKNAISYLTIK